MVDADLVLDALEFRALLRAENVEQKRQGFDALAEEEEEALFVAGVFAEEGSDGFLEAFFSLFFGDRSSPAGDFSVVLVQ